MTRLSRWFYNGSNKEDGTIGWILGTALHWRIWAVVILGGMPIVAGLITLQYGTPFSAILVTTFIGGLSHPKMMEISPKYDITKNY